MSQGNPIHRDNQIIFEKETGQLIVAAYGSGILVIHGWTVSIDLNDVKNYVATFGQSSISQADRGFLFQDPFMVLSHGGAKLALSPQEAIEIVKFLANHYDLECWGMANPQGD